MQREIAKWRPGKMMARMPWTRLSGRKTTGMALGQMGLAVWNAVEFELGLLPGELWSSSASCSNSAAGLYHENMM